MGAYPPEIQGPSAWYGPQLDARRDWIEALSDAEVAEIERATQLTIDRLRDPERELVSLRKQDFPLPSSRRAWGASWARCWRGAASC